MPDLKISQLTAATTPLDGTEVLPIVQGGTTDQVTVADLTAGRAIAATSLTVGAGAVGTPSLTTSGDLNTGIFFPAADTVAIAEGGAEVLRVSSDGRVGIGQTSPATKLDLTGAYAGNATAMAALDVDCSAGNYFTKTINGASTFTVSNVPASRSYTFTLELEHTSGAITWFSGVEWPGGTAPTLTTGKTHLFMFQTDNGGTRWRASSLINYTT